MIHERRAAPEGTALYLAAQRGDRFGLPDLDDARRSFASWRAAGLRRVVLVSSAMTVSPHPHHPGFVDESRRTPRGEQNPIAARWLALEALAHEILAGHSLLVLRPTPVVVPGGGDFWSRLFSKRRVAVLPGHDPSLQLLSPDDLEAAITAALASNREGTYFVPPRTVVPLRRALELARARVWVLPRWVQRIARWLFPHHFAPLALLDYTRYFWTVSGAALERDLGVAPARSSAEAVCPGETRSFDDFGLDPAFVARHRRRVVGFLEKVWWRVETRGFENLPTRGAAILVGMHRGFMPWDGVMALHGVHRATGRFIRFLIHPLLLRFPFLFDFMAKQGGVPASEANADRLIAKGELVGIYPEGLRGAFTFYREAYRIGPAWRTDYAELALRHRVPVVPFVTLGSAEAYPILGKIEWRWWRKVSEWPFVPLTPTFPLLPLPLPAKWHTQFLPPIDVAARYPEDAARDPQAIAELDAEVRTAIESAVAWMRARRRSWFFGSIFGPTPEGCEPAARRSG